MDGFGGGGFGAGTFGGGIGEARSVSVDVYTSAFRVSGEVETRFSRVTEILNQLTGSHLHVMRATLSEHADASSAVAAPAVLVAVDEILVMVAPDLGGPAGEMRIPKRPVLAHLGLPPLRVTGKIHVSMGSRPVDGLVQGTDRFIAMTDATIVSGEHPQLQRDAPVIAIRRDRAHVLLVADDERPEQLLADVLDETTAAAWLRGDAGALEAEG